MMLALLDHLRHAPDGLQPPPAEHLPAAPRRELCLEPGDVHLLVPDAVQQLIPQLSVRGPVLTFSSHNYTSKLFLQIHK